MQVKMEKKEIGRHVNKSKQILTMLKSIQKWVGETVKDTEKARNSIECDGENNSKYINYHDNLRLKDCQIRYKKQSSWMLFIEDILQNKDVERLSLIEWEKISWVNGNQRKPASY